MPSRYSHGVVLANYSSRGVINLPHDKHLEYVKSYGTPLSVPTDHNSSSTARSEGSSAPVAVEPGPVDRSISSKILKSSNKQAPATSEDRATFRESRTGNAGYSYETLAKISRATTPASDDRKLIVESDDESTGNGSFRPRFQPRSSEDHRATSVFPIQNVPLLNHASHTSGVDLQAQPSRKTHDLQANAENEGTSVVQRYESGFAAQKYQPRGALGNPPRSPVRDSLTPHTLDGRAGGIVPEPLLSVHEFLGRSRRAKVQEEDVDSASRPSIRQHASRYQVTSPSPPSRTKAPPSDDLQQQSRSSANRGRVSVNDLPDNDNNGKSSQNKLTKDARFENDDGPNARRASGKRKDAAKSPRNAMWQHEPAKEPDIELPNGHDDAALAPAKLSSSSAASTSRIPSNRMGDPTLRSTSMEARNKYDTSGDKVLVEPDFSNFTDDEEMTDPMNRAVGDIHIHRRYYRAVDNNVPARELRPKISLSASLQSSRRKSSRLSPSLRPLRSRTTSVGSDDPKRQLKTTTREGRTGEPQVDATRLLYASESDISIGGSEEDIRMKIPTPIPSPTISIAPKTTTLSHGPRTPTRESSSNQANYFGVPSIERSPLRTRHTDGNQLPDIDIRGNVLTTRMPTTGNVDRRRTEIRSRIEQADDTAKPLMSHKGPPMLSSESESEVSKRWALRTAAGSPNRTFKRSSVQTAPKAGRRLNHRPVSELPRPQTAVRTPLLTQDSSRTMRLGSTDQSLVTAFDDVSSLSSLGMGMSNSHEHDFYAPKPPFQAFTERRSSSASRQANQEEEDEDEDEDADEDDPDSDGDIALPPPDISRFPPPSRSESSPRSTRSDRNRLSSFTSLPRRTKSHRKSKSITEIQARNRGDSFVEILRSGPAANRNRGGNIESGNGKATGEERLGAILLEAEEEAKANRGVKGFWGRMKKRIES